jgi:hypothetical protein
MPEATREPPSLFDQPGASGTSTFGGSVQALLSHPAPDACGCGGGPRLERRRTMTRCPKLRDRDEIAAKLALAKVQWQDKDGHAERRAYRCPDCRQWHLTSRRVWVKGDQIDHLGFR